MECPVCYNDFVVGTEEDDSRAPYYLDCGHYYCKTCAYELNQCAMCRETIGLRIRSLHFEDMKALIDRKKEGSTAEPERTAEKSERERSDEMVHRLHLQSLLHTCSRLAQRCRQLSGWPQQFWKHLCEFISRANAALSVPNNSLQQLYFTSAYLAFGCCECLNFLDRAVAERLLRAGQQLVLGTMQPCSVKDFSFLQDLEECIVVSCDNTATAAACTSILGGDMLAILAGLLPELRDGSLSTPFGPLGSLRDRAACGDRAAMRMIAMCYRTGFGHVGQSMRKSLMWQYCAQLPRLLVKYNDDDRVDNAIVSADSESFSQFMLRLQSSGPNDMWDAEAWATEVVSSGQKNEYPTAVLVLIRAGRYSGALTLIDSFPDCAVSIDFTAALVLWEYCQMKKDGVGAEKWLAHARPLALAHARNPADRWSCFHVGRTHPQEVQRWKGKALIGNVDALWRLATHYFSGGLDATGHEEYHGFLEKMVSLGLMSSLTLGQRLEVSFPLFGTGATDIVRGFLSKHLRAAFAADDGKDKKAAASALVRCAHMSRVLPEPTVDELLRWYEFTDATWRAQVESLRSLHLMALDKVVPIHVALRAIEGGWEAHTHIRHHGSVLQARNDVAREARALMGLSDPYIPPTNGSDWLNLLVSALLLHSSSAVVRPVWQTLLNITPDDLDEIRPLFVFGTEKYRPHPRFYCDILEHLSKRSFSARIELAERQVSWMGRRDAYSLLSKGEKEGSDSAKVMKTRAACETLRLHNFISR